MGLQPHREGRCVGVRPDRRIHRAAVRLDLDLGHLVGVAPTLLLLLVLSPAAEAGLRQHPDQEGPRGNRKLEREALPPALDRRRQDLEGGLGKELAAGRR